MKSTLIILAACVLAVPIGLVMLAVIPVALAYGAAVDRFERRRAELERENRRLRARVEELCESLAARQFPPARCGVTAERMTRMFGTLN